MVHAHAHAGTHLQARVHDQYTLTIASILCIAASTAFSEAPMTVISPAQGTIITTVIMQSMPPSEGPHAVTLPARRNARVTRINQVISASINISSDLRATVSVVAVLSFGRKRQSSFKRWCQNDITCCQDCSDQSVPGITLGQQHLGPQQVRGLLHPNNASNIQFDNSS